MWYANEKLADLLDRWRQSGQVCSILPAPNIQAAKNLILFIPSQDAPVECQKILQEARVGLTEERPAKPKKNPGTTRAFPPQRTGVFLSFWLFFFFLSWASASPR